MNTFITAYWNLKDAQAHLDKLILSTPTGPIRDVLTEANIHTLAAVAKLEEIKKLL